jgi:hypothetical protein
MLITRDYKMKSEVINMLMLASLVVIYKCSMKGAEMPATRVTITLATPFTVFKQSSGATHYVKVQTLPARNL